jgi:hypothetical protein
LTSISKTDIGCRIPDKIKAVNREILLTFCARKDYRLTAKGRQVPATVKEQLKELYREVVREAGRKH